MRKGGMEARRITNCCKMWWVKESCWCLRVEVLLREDTF